MNVLRRVAGPLFVARRRRLTVGMRRAACLLSVSFLVLLCMAAHATPPEPLWIPGIYDGGDFDDLVLLVGTADGLEVPAIEPLPPHARSVIPPDPSGPIPAALPAVHSRAPPLG